MIGRQAPFVLLALGVVGTGCANWDNPTALSELSPQTDVVIKATRLETFEEYEIEAFISEAGTPLEMLRVALEVKPIGDGPARIIEMDQQGDGYEALIEFFEPGEHRLRLLGMPRGHRLMGELGEREVEVFRRHQIIGGHWVELAVNPAPPLEGREGHVRLYAFELAADGSRGPPAGGLEIRAEMHRPDGSETHLEMIEEEEGEYVAEAAFESAGLYEIHVEMEDPEEEGEFTLPVLGEDPTVSDGDTGG